VSSPVAVRASADTLIRVQVRGRTADVALAEYLDPAPAEAAERLGNQWIKALRHARVGGQPLRDRFTYRGDSLWWFTELFLHKQRTAARAFGLASALEALIARESPEALAVVRGDRLAGWVARQVAGAAGVRMVNPTAASPWMKAAGRALAARLYASAPALRRWRRRSIGPTARPDVAVFVHSAFWKDSTADDTYVGPVLKALASRLPPDAVRIVGVGPMTTHRARTWRRRLDELSDANTPAGLVPIEALTPASAIEGSRQWWRDRRRVARALLRSDDVRAAGRVAGYDLWPFVAEDLTGVATLQFPWSARAMDEAGAALDALAPKVVVTYAEAGGWGRALVLEARRRGIASVGLQHGFISRHWLNYLHEPDEIAPSAGNSADRGCPLPDVTLLYDEFARRHLLEAGRYPADRLQVTGNPRLDAIVAASRALSDGEIARVRRDAGAGDDQHLVLLAAKRIPEFDATFAALIQAVAGLPDVHLAIRPHPAETPDPYVALARGVGNVRVVPLSLDPVALIRGSRLVATINSTVAIEAMALDVPALAMRLPNYLSPFVDAGAMAGTSRLDEIGPAVARLVFDDAARAALAAARRVFLGGTGAGADGGSAARAADVIARLAR
jgi:hypothetical protein